MGFQQGLSGLNAASKSLDVIGNNVANVNTVGFKSSIAQFADVYANSMGGGKNAIGIGTILANVVQQFTQGSINTTNNALDVAINGSGFFRMSSAGAITYTRNGQFLMDKEGYVTNADGDRLTGYPADVNGAIVPAAPQELYVTQAELAPKATTEVRLGLNVDSRQAPPVQAPFNPNNNRTYNSSTSATLYDSLGNPHTLTTYFVKSATPNQWDMYANLDGGVPLAPVQLDFSTNGVLTTVMPINLGFTVNTGATAALNVELDLGEMTQFGSEFGVTALSQDGYTSGRMAGMSIGADGTLMGRYTNGQTRNLGQIVLVNFANPNALQHLGGNQWAESADSGAPLVGAPGTGNLGVVQSAAIEESNVDVTVELVNMITAQRAYQANAQTIKTMDTVMQTLVNLR